MFLIRHITKLSLMLFVGVFWVVFFFVEGGGGGVLFFFFWFFSLEYFQNVLNETYHKAFPNVVVLLFFVLFFSFLFCGGIVFCLVLLFRIY